MFRAFAAVLAGVLTAALPASSSAQLPALNAVMQEKAENAQRLLKPLVLADFAGIEQYATRLGRLTSTEVASWQTSPSPEYLKQANTFLESIESLGQAASARDVRRASAAYTSLVSSCVNCHLLVKTRKSVSLTPPAPRIEPRPPAGGRDR